MHYRNQKWSGVDSWYVVSVDCSGNPIGIASDGTVWIFDHNQMKSEKIHNSFEDWINEDCLAVEEDDDEES